MQILVHDTLTTLEPLFTSTDSPKALLEKAKPLLFDPNGLQVRLGNHVANKEENGFYVMQAAQQDGFHVLAMQQVWGLFNSTRNRDVSTWQFEQFEQKNVAMRVEQTLRTLCQLIPDQLLPPVLNCYLFPTDPANRPLMINNHGLSGFGFAPGHLFLQIWPSDGNLTRLQPLLARLLIHNICPLPTDRPQTLEDWLMIEGQSSSFIELACSDYSNPKRFRTTSRNVEMGQNFSGELYSQTPWLDWLAAPVDWEETLAQIATRYGIATYNDLVVNVYATMQPIGPDRPPPAVALEVDEREYALEVIRDGFGETDPNRIAAYLYGDEIVAEQGHSGIGLPPYAGFEAAHHMVQKYLDGKNLKLFDAMQDKSTHYTQMS